MTTNDTQKPPTSPNESLQQMARRCRVEVWNGRMAQWRFVREYASRPNAKRAILALKEKLGTHELRWMDSPSDTAH